MNKRINMYEIFLTSITISVHYLYFSDNCPHLCCHVYHNILAVVRSTLFGYPVTYPKSVSSIPSEGSGELSEGKLTGNNW